MQYDPIEAILKFDPISVILQNLTLDDVHRKITIHLVKKSMTYKVQLPKSDHNCSESKNYCLDSNGVILYQIFFFKYIFGIAMKLSCNMTPKRQFPFLTPLVSYYKIWPLIMFEKNFKTFDEKIKPKYIHVLEKPGF